MNYVQFTDKKWVAGCEETVTGSPVTELRFEI
jgi:hypothetical protein